MNLPTEEPNSLSERELEVLELVATGASNKQVAQQLSISQNTVKVHLRNIFTKIGAASRTEAAMYAVRIGLVQPAPGTDGDGKAKAPTSTAAGRPAWLAWGLEPPGRWIALALLLTLAAAAVALVVVLSGSPQAATTGSEALPTLPPRWLPGPGLPEARAGLAAVTYENRIYAIGGERPGEVVGTVSRFELADNRWQTGLTEKPTPVADIQAVVVGGRIFVPGGRGESGAPLDILEIYDPREDQWSRGASLPGPLSGYALVAFEGRIYLFGGWDGEQYRVEALRYDPADDAWEALPPIPSPRAFAGAAVAGNRIYLLGGWDGDGPLNQNLEFLPAEGEANPWRALTPMPQARARMGLVSIAGILHVIGGEGDQPDLPSLKYFPVDDQWETFEASGGEDWSGMGVAALDTSLHAIGGLEGGEPSAAHQTYQAIFTIVIPVVR